MLSIIAKWWIQPGREDDAVAALRELASAVEEQEPFTIMYLIDTAIVEGSRPSPPNNEVVFVSGWPDRAAFQQHLDGPVKRAVDPSGLFRFQQGIGSQFRPSASEPLDLSPLNRTVAPDGAL